MRIKNKLLQSIVGLFAASVVGGAMTGCNKEPLYTPPVLKSTNIYDFWLEKTSNNAGINRAYQGMIVGDTAIRLLVDYGTNINALEPTVFADADSISPKGVQNFSNPVKYTVWANGTSATYTVRIKVSPIEFPVFTSIAAGYSHVMALKNDGTVWVCGDNSSGQLGLGDYSSRNRLTQVPVYDAEKIFSGEAASIIKLKDGTAWGTGNQFGQLGIGNKNPINSLTRTPFLDDAAQIAILFENVFALKPDGTVWGAGWNRGKILGLGDAELRASFVKIPIENAKQISGNASDIVVVKNNGEAWGWGTNYGGQLGLGDKQARYTPVLLPTPSVGVSKVYAGGSTIFLKDNNGKIWGAGANLNGQLGLGDFNNRTAFTQIPFFDNKTIETIAPRLGTTGFKEANGTIWNVGDNYRGQLGLGNASTIPYSTPVKLTSFTTNMLAGFGQTSYALKSDGTLWAWGSGSSGALGTGNTSSDTSTPIQLK